MPLPRYCPRPTCPNHHSPRYGWRRRFGVYHTLAHGPVQRFQCRACGKTMGTQTESLHYYAKRRLPLSKIWISLAGGAAVREVAVRYGTTSMALQSAVLRLGRQAMAAQAHLLDALEERSTIVFDGLRSFVTSQDFPCDLTTAVDPAGETILSIVHSLSIRGGTMTQAQRRRLKRKLARWRPPVGGMSRALSLLISEIWNYLRPSVATPGRIDTDEHPLYKRLLDRDPVTACLRGIGILTHRRTPGSAARTRLNPLFAVNYVDRLVRHRVREHMRETIAFGRHASVQMHRAWLFAWEHNARRPWRVRVPECGVHAVAATDAGPQAVAPEVITRMGHEFFSRRIRLAGCHVPHSMCAVWLLKLPTPPLRWRKGQARAPAIRVPNYARRDLAQGDQQAL